MNRSTLDLERVISRVPRVCGDEPEQCMTVSTGAYAFPAYAGMNRIRDLIDLSSTSVPRVCGDEPDCFFVLDSTDRRSPRMRG